MTRAGRTWEVDPRTVPEPEDPRIAAVEEWAEGYNGERAAILDLLARLDALTEGGQS